ncbi:DUF5009 domain-containing protein, partial [bacterium]|nr:DUF5009 domain-containing protein [bacterium]
MNQSADYRLTKNSRLLSLDFFRGFTMFLLVGSATGLYHHMADPAFEGTLLGFIGTQLEHH